MGSSFFRVVSLAVAASICRRSWGLDNGLALTPPMGWLSWERFGCQTNCTAFPDSCISETLYLIQGRLLLEHGYLDAGYEYVNIDDCWSEMERVDGQIVEDRKRFPHGLKNLSATLHSWGLKLGLYGDIGTKTCAGYPGFVGRFEEDTWRLAHEWEVDSIKVDACNANASNFPVTYPAFGKALNRTGRPIFYSCSWPSDYYEQYNHWEDPDYLNHGIKQTCNSWRNYNDIFDSWESVSSIINYFARNSSKDVLVRAAGRGGWNDPDMLVIGNPGLSFSEQQTQFAMWAIFAAPLMMSVDLRTISEESREILLNEDIIAVNQDPLGRQGWCTEKATAYTRIWVRELVPTWWNATAGEDNESCPPGTSDSWSVVLENHNTIFWKESITFDPRRHLPQGQHWHSFFVRDLVARQDVGIFENNMTVLVDESSVAMYKVFFISKEQQATLR